MKIRIIIADDNQIDREGVQRILERESDMEVVGVADLGSSAARSRLVGGEQD